MSDDIQSAVPADNVPISELPEAIRYLKAWILTQGLQQNAISATSFGAGVVNNTPVYFNTVTNQWEATKDAVGLRKYSGFADITNNRVIIFGAVSSLAWNWDVSNGNVIIYADATGALTIVNSGTAPPVAVAISPTCVIINPVYGSSLSWLLGTLVAGAGDLTVVVNQTTLRAIDASVIANNDAFLVLGGTTAGDGRGGLYIWDDDSAGADDGATIIVPDVPVGAGRYVMAGPQTAPIPNAAIVAANYNVAVTDHTLFVDASGGNRNINLLAAANGHEISIIRIDDSANVVTITADGAELISGNASIDLAMGYESITLVPYGNNYYTKGA